VHKTVKILTIINFLFLLTQVILSGAAVLEWMRYHNHWTLIGLHVIIYAFTPMTLILTGVFLYQVNKRGFQTTKLYGYSQLSMIGMQLLMIVLYLVLPYF